MDNKFPQGPRLFKSRCFFDSSLNYYYFYVTIIFTWNIVDVAVMITVCMDLTRTKYKNTNTTSSETTDALFYLRTCQEVK